MTDFQKTDKNLIKETQKTEKEINKSRTDRKENKANNKRIICKINIGVKIKR